MHYYIVSRMYDSGSPCVARLGRVASPLDAVAAAVVLLLPRYTTTCSTTVTEATDWKALLNNSMTPC